MARLADLAEIVGFFSYSRRDDQHSGGALSKLRTRIHDELRLQLGRDLRVWQDTAAIPHGTLWEEQIRSAIAESVFFIPIVTPSAVASDHCKLEFGSFLAREAALQRADLVFPILYIRVPALADAEERRRSEVLRTIHDRQYADWTRIRMLDIGSFDVGQRVENLCGDIVEALRKTRVVSDGRTRQQAPETVPPAAWEEAPPQPPSPPRAEPPAPRMEPPPAPPPVRPQAAEERAFVAAKRDDTVEALDDFLGAYPGSRHAADAAALRSTLAARDEMYGKTIAARDAAPLDAFLRSYPHDKQAKEVRWRLRKIRPMDFLFGLRQPNGIWWAILFYVLHLIILVVPTALVGGFLGVIFGPSTGIGGLGVIAAITYCVLLCAWTIHRRRLHPACYAFVLLVIPAAFILGGMLGLVVPAVLTTRGR